MDAFTTFPIPSSTSDAAQTPSCDLSTSETPGVELTLVDYECNGNGCGGWCIIACKPSFPQSNTVLLTAPLRTSLSTYDKLDAPMLAHPSMPHAFNHAAISFRLSLSIHRCLRRYFSLIFASLLLGFPVSSLPGAWYYSFSLTHAFVPLSTHNYMYVNC